MEGPEILMPKIRLTLDTINKNKTDLSRSIFTVLPKRPGANKQRAPSDSQLNEPHKQAISPNSDEQNTKQN